VLSDPTASFYKGVDSVDSLEAEAMYERDGIEFDILINLEAKDKKPDISKPELQKVVEKMYKKGLVVSKKVVPPPPIHLE
jgi:hypothetical protein